MKKRVLLSGVAIAALMMTGCGGGGSGRGDTAEATIHGVAVDDLILNGKVEAYDANDKLLAEGRTNSNDGSYTLSFAHEGVVVVNVRCDANSKMKDMQTGVIKACSDSVDLHSVASVASGVKQQVNITPLTEVVFERAKEMAATGAKLDKEDVAKARSEIGLMFSIDPIADNPTKGTYEDVVASINKLATTQQGSVMDITKELVNELKDGQADGQADDTLNSLIGVMKEHNVINNLVESGGEYTPPSIDPARLSDIAEAKALFRELRTQAMSVVDYDESGTPGFLDTESEAMEQTLEKSVLDIGQIGRTLGEVVGAIGEAIEDDMTQYSEEILDDTKTVTVKKRAKGSWDYTIKENGTEKWQGTIVFPEEIAADDAIEQLYTDGTLKITVDGTVPLGEDKKGAEDSQSFKGEVTLAKNAKGADLSISGMVASNGTSIELKTATATLGYVKGEGEEDEGEPDFHFIKLHKVVLQGKVGAYTIDGSIVVNSYVENSHLKERGFFENRKESSFEVSFYCRNNMPMTPKNVTFEYEGHTYQPSWHYSVYRFDEIEGELAYRDITDNIHYEPNGCPEGDNGIVEVNDFDTDSDKKVGNSGWLPNDITLEGAIGRTGASLRGTLNAKWLNAATMDPSNDQAKAFVKVDFEGRLKMPERPEMLTTINFESGAQSNKFDASYTYDSTVIKLLGKFDSEMEKGTVDITSHTGIKATLVFDDGLKTDGTSKVTKDGKVIGSLEEREDAPVIKYLDGSFESLP